MKNESNTFDIELKQKLTEMLAWFHDYCVSNNLRYYVLGGTMLGAARHKGFIPWDDDIDVGMPRADYEKLAKLMGDRQFGKYVLETPHSQAIDFLYTFSKIYDTTTTLVENTKAGTKRGIYLDLFPLDGLADTEEESHKRFKKIDFRFNLLLARVTGVRKGRSFMKNAAVRVLPIIPQFIVNDKKLQVQIDDMCKQNDFDKYKYGGNLLGAWRYKEVMENRIMGRPTLYPFENISVYGAENYDEYLTHLYGDWRKLPPVEKRVTHHDFAKCDLHKSYLDK